MCWWLVGRLGVVAAPGSRLAGDPVRLLHPDPVGHDARRRLAHGHLIATMLTLRCLIELCGQPARLAHRAARGRRVPDPGAARVRDAVLCAPPDPAPASRPAGPSGGYIEQPTRPPVARLGLARDRVPAVARRLLRLQPATASGRPSSPATRWRRCRRSSRPARSRAVLAHPHLDEPRLPVLPPAEARSRTSRSSGPTAWACRSS